MSTRRGWLLAGAAFFALTLIFLLVLVAFDEAVGHHPAFYLLALAIAAASATCGGSYQATSACERSDRANGGRIDELAAQIAGLAEMVADYGDSREAGGYLAATQAKAENVRSIR